MAVARWPTKETRELWLANRTDGADASAGMRDAIDRRFDDLEIEVTDDLAVMDAAGGRGLLDNY